jgi:hypothetical protein
MAGGEGDFIAGVEDDFTDEGAIGLEFGPSRAASLVHLG